MNRMVDVVPKTVLLRCYHRVAEINLYFRRPCVNNENDQSSI